MGPAKRPGDRQQDGFRVFGGSWGFFNFLHVGVLLARVLPTRLLIRSAGVCGRWIGRFHRSRWIVADNLTRIREYAISPDGSVPGVLRAHPVQPVDVFESYGAYWGEFLALATRPALTKRLRIRVEGEEHFGGWAERGPLCFLTGHLGNWDLAAAWLADRLPNLAVVAEELTPEGLFRFFTDIRRRAGYEVLPSDGSGQRLYRHLRQGGHAEMVIDRVLDGGGEPVRFLGGTRIMVSGGVKIARRAGATLIPIFLLRDGAGYVIKVHPPLGGDGDVVQEFASALECEVRQRPEQWCVLYPLYETSVREC